MTLAKYNQFLTAPRASAPDYQMSVSEILADAMCFDDETLDHFQMLADANKLQGVDAVHLIEEAIKYEAGVRTRAKMARKSKAAKRLVRILTKAMLRAMDQGEEDLAEDLSEAICRHTTVWADAHNASQ